MGTEQHRTQNAEPSAATRASIPSPSWGRGTLPGMHPPPPIANETIPLAQVAKRAKSARSKPNGRTSSQAVKEFSPRLGMTVSRADASVIPTRIPPDVRSGQFLMICGMVGKGTAKFLVALHPVGPWGPGLSRPGESADFDVPRVWWCRYGWFQATGWADWCSSSISTGVRIPSAE